MNTNYSTFSYNDDFTPQYNIFNTNTSNKRFVGIGTHKPKHFLDVVGNVSTSNLIVNNKFLYNDSDNSNNIHLFQVNNKNKIINPTLISSDYEETGTEWTIVNNNDIKLTLRNLNDNTRLHYNSVFFSIYNNNSNINIYLNSSFTLKYLYITKINKDQLSNTNREFINNNNVLITTNDLSSTIYSNNSSNLFKLNSFITLSQGSQTINIQNLINLEYSETFRVQFIGTYEYYSSSLWDKNSDTNTVFTLNNVGIGTTIPKSNLHIIGNTTITHNLSVNNKLTTNLLNITELHNTGYSNISNIEPIHNSLIINSDKNPIGIGSTTPTDFLDIGSNFKIKHNGNIIFNNLNITNNINLTKNITLINPESSIILNNSSNIIYKLNDKTILNDTNKYINLQNKLIIDSTTDNYDHKKDIMYVSGNVNILGNLTTNDYSKSFIYNPNDSQTHTTLNSNNTTINNLLSTSGFLYTDTLESTSIDILDYFNIVLQENNIPIFNYPYIYYNTTTKKYMIFNNNIIYNINHTISLMDFSFVVKIFSNNASDITYINTDTCITNILDNNKIFTVNNAQMFFNVNSLNEEIIFNNKVHHFDLF